MERRATRDPSITDVARLAGVSHQTVSRVLNEHPNVREQTRLRVRAAIAELGYRPNLAARVLASGRSRVIGVVAQNSNLYGPASLLASFEHAAAGAGFAVNVGLVDALSRTSIAEAVELHREQRVAGIVAIVPTVSAADALSTVSPGLPLVTIDGDPARPTALVTVDQEEGAYAATAHLLAAGHSTVWHVSGPSDWFDSAGRVRGWQHALQDAGADIPPVVPADWSAASGYRTGLMLARMPDVTAVFAANDHLCLGILRAMHELGRKVPQDVSVVGFDDLPEAAYFIPPLTTVRPDFEAVARESLTLLLAQVGQAEITDAHRTIPPTLVERSSVAPPA